MEQKPIELLLSQTYEFYSEAMPINDLCRYMNVKELGHFVVSLWAKHGEVCSIEKNLAIA